MNNENPKTAYNSIDQYISAQPESVQFILEELRQTIRQAVPDASEVISYGMPAFKANTVLVYFAAYKHHIGFYPTSKPIMVFKEELADYKTSKGAIQFPISMGIPKALVKKIVEFRMQEDELKTLTKKTRKK